MLPFLFTVGEFGVHTYTLLLSVAFFVAMGIWYRETRPFKIAGDKIINLSLGAFVTGLVGARLLFILTQLPQFLNGELDFWQLWRGGIVFLGGLLGACVFLHVAFRRYGIDRWVGFNTAAPALAAAHVVGRIGCFANGCCHGDVCDLPWAVTFNNPLSAARPLHTPLHPSQLYEALGLAILAAVLLRLKRYSRGVRWPSAQIYLAGYGILRFLVEFTRGDSLRGKWLLFSTSQWLSIAAIIMAIYLDFMRPRSHNLPHES